MAFEKRGKRERACHHHFSGRKSGVASVHITEVDLSLIGDSRPTKQCVVLVKENDLYASVG
jgi:hypothetical protein